MRRRHSMLLAGGASAFAVLLLGASSAQLTTHSSAHQQHRVSLLAAAPVGQEPSLATPARLGLDVAAQQAATKAEQGGADVSIAILDRQTGQLVTSGDSAAFPTASVSKLFIADDLLMGLEQARRPLSPDDRRQLDIMLRASDDFAADAFWERGGGNAVIDRIAARYGLRGITAPYDGNWWNTMTTTADLVRYYDMLLDGAGGLPSTLANTILSDLAAAAPVGVDGYPQRFGIPDGLFDEPVAVKQGWMCCWNGPNQVHLSTGVAGPDHRFAIAVASMQPVDESTARDTVTEILKTMFPAGRI